MFCPTERIKLNWPTNFAKKTEGNANLSLMKKIFSRLLRGFGVLLTYGGINLIFFIPLVLLPLLAKFNYDRQYTRYGDMNLSHYPWLYRVQFENNFYLYQSYLLLFFYACIAPIIAYKLLKRFNFLGLSSKVVKLEIILLTIITVIQVVF